MKTLYFDMDGVLVDLYGSMKEMLGRKRIEFNMNHDRQKWFEEDLVEFTDRGGFFTARAMPLFGHLENFTKYLTRDYKHTNCEILTSLGGFYPDSSEVARQKKEWLAAHSPEVFNLLKFNFTHSGKEKANFATTNGVSNILIDDTPSNNSEFTSRGGRAFTYTPESHNGVLWAISSALN